MGEIERKGVAREESIWVINWTCFEVDTIQDRLKFYRSTDPEIFLVKHIWLYPVTLSFHTLLARVPDNLGHLGVLCLRIIVNGVISPSPSFRLHFFRISL